MEEKGEYAVENVKFFSSLPQAIICTDFMAITVASALEERGINIPKIWLSGCDDVDDAAEYSPSLTQFKFLLSRWGWRLLIKLIVSTEGEERKTPM